MLLLACLSAQPAAAAWFPSSTCDSPAPPAGEGRDLLLHVQLDEADPGDDDVLHLSPAGELLASGESLTRWGLRPPPDQGGAWHRLADVPGLDFRYDHCNQELLLDLTHTARAAYAVSLEDARHAPAPAAVPGGFFNADVQLAAVAGDTSIAGLGELGLFAGRGHGGSTFFAGDGEFVRLDTAWTLDRPEAAERLVLGDAISRSAPGRRALRFGGLTWGTDFSLQPDVVTFPLPALRGDAAVPSTVEVYVDGMLRSRQDVPSGPFEVNRVPVISGGGDLQLVVRDLFGRTQVLSQPFYAAPQLLRAGLFDYGVDGGWLRQRYGAASADYGPGFVAGTLRYGVSDRLTLDSQIDAAAGHRGVGLGASRLWPRLGVGSIALAASRSDRGTGARAELGFERSARGFSGGFALQLADPRYVGLGEIEPPPRSLLQLHAGAPLGGGASLGSAALFEERRAAPRLRIYSLDYSQRLGLWWSLNARVARIELGADRDWVTGLGIARSFGLDNVSAEWEHDANGATTRLAWQHNSGQALGLDYRAGLESGPFADRALGGMRWSGQRGAVQADADVSSQHSGLRLGLQSGIAVLGDQAFWTRPVGGSFAVVQAGDAAGVRVYRDHQLVARTDAHGRALVPDLRAYELNQIMLDDSDLPIDNRIDVLARDAVPFARSGLGVSFPVSSAVARNLRLQLPDGSWVPSGAELTLAGGQGRALMGLRGRVLLDQGAATATLAARWRDAECTATLPADPGDGREEVLQCVPAP